MKILQSTEDPYSLSIRDYLISEFPKLAVTQRDKLEAITSVLLGTNQTRYGPLPSPETQVAIRAIIREAIDKEQPIPVLIPWGGRKTDYRAGLDVAELLSLRLLEALQRRITELHAPGLTVNIRLEDLGAWWIYRHEGAASRASSIGYTDDFQKLALVLGVNSYVHPIAESTLMLEDQYFSRAGGVASYIYAYLLESLHHHPLDWKNLPSYQKLMDLGWHGIIPQEQRDHYLSKYEKLYPGTTADERFKILADYLAGSLVRYQLGGTAAPARDSIVISFVQQIPGAPDRPGAPRLYYRTLPASAARTHIPAWRGKGYFKIGEGTVTPKICSFQDIPQDLNHCSVTLEADCGAVKVQVATDYVLA